MCNSFDGREQHFFSSNSEYAGALTLRAKGVGEIGTRPVKWAASKVVDAFLKLLKITFWTFLKNSKKVHTYWVCMHAFDELFS
jgi:hypothetical protein